MTLNCLYAKEITEAANKFNLDPFLVAAMVKTESSFDTRALRFEPHFKWTFEVESLAKSWKVTHATMEASQKFSYGLLQIMGATAYWQGFQGYVLHLAKTKVGLHWGCKYFAYHLKKHGDRDKAIVSYNAGSPRWDRAKNEWENQHYLDKVLKAYEELTHAHDNAGNV